MGAPFLRHRPNSDSWFTRVRENFRQAFASTRLTHSSSNGAPIHLLELDATGKEGRAQTVSLLTHSGIIGALALLAGLVALSVILFFTIERPMRLAILRRYAQRATTAPSPAITA